MGVIPIDPTVPTIPPLYQVLIEQVSCGENNLSDLLRSQWLALSCLANECDPAMRYGKLQLYMIDAALDAARNRVDESRSQSKSEGKNWSRSKGISDSRAQRTNEGRSCAWGRATSYSQSMSDSDSHSRGRSDSYAESHNNSLSYSWDRGRQWASGCATSFSDSTSDSVSDGSGFSAEDSRSVSFGSSGTPIGLGPDLNNIDPGIVDPPFTYATIDFCVPFTEFCVSIPNPTTFSWVGFNEPANDGFVNPGAHFPFCGDENEPCEPMASYGRGWNANYNLSVTIPFAGASGANWGNGENFNQSFTCSSSNSASQGDSISHSESEGNSVSHSESESESFDESHNVQNAFSRSDSVSDSFGHSFSTNRSVAGSRGQNRSGSDNASHSENQASGQGTAWSKSHSEGSNEGVSDSTSSSESYRWGQIFDSLNAMRERALKDLMDIQRILSASMSPAMSCIKTREVCRHVPKCEVTPCGDRPAIVSYPVSGVARMAGSSGYVW